MSRESTRALLEPESIAVIGASEHAHKPGAVLVRSLVEGGFPGSVHPIHPRADEILGRKAYPTVADVPGGVDLAFVVLGRDHVKPAVQQCADAGVKAVAIISAGFAETGEWGGQEQAEIAAIIEKAGMAAIGPNTIGLITMNGLLRGSFVQFNRWTQGGVAIAAQSGIFAGSVGEELMARPRQKLGLHTSISIGNRIRTTESDLLDAFADTPEIDVIGLYLESFADAELFMRRAAEVKRTKPVVVLKSGRTEQGRAAAASHTGSLAADDDVVDQLLRQHGIVRAQDDVDFLSLLKAFSYAPRRQGRRVGVVTFSGAMGVIASDALLHNGLELAEYEQGTVDRIAELLPEWQAARNPADLWPAIDLDPRNALVDGLSSAMADPNVDHVLGILLAVDNADFDDLAKAMVTVRESAPDKPLHLVIVGGLRDKWTDAIEGLGIPAYDSVTEAVRAIGATAWYEEHRDSVPSALAG